MSTRKRISRILSILMIASMVLSYNSSIAFSVWAAADDTTEVAEEAQDSNQKDAQAEDKDSQAGTDDKNTDSEEAKPGEEKSDAAEEAQAEVDEEEIAEEEQEAVVSESPMLGIVSEPTDSVSAVNFERILGRAAEYGILADTYEQNNHSQTNFAVKNYIFRGYNDDPDIAGSHVVPFIIAKMEDGDRPGILFGSSTAEGKKMQYDIYTDSKYQETIDREIAEDTQSDQRTYIRLNDKTKVETHMIYQDTSTITNNVTSMITHITQWSDTLKDKTANIQLPENPNGNKYVLDTTEFDDNTVVYVDVPKSFADTMLNKMASLDSSGEVKQGFVINKKANQNIVLNINNSSSITVMKMVVNVGGTVTNTGDENNPNYIISPVNSVSSDTDITDTAHNQKVDTDLAQHLILNFYGTGDVELNTVAGCVIAPRADVTVKGSSAGWIASGQKVTNSGAEFHFIYRNRKYTETTRDAIYFSFTKEVWDSDNHNLGLLDKTYTFDLYETESDYSIDDLTPVQSKTTNENSKVTFDEIEITEDSVGTHYYVIKEQNAGEVIDNIKYWDGQLNIKVIIEADGSGFKKTVETWKSEHRTANGVIEKHNNPFVVNNPEVTNGEIINSYIDTAKLVITKTFDGLNVTESELNGAIKFTVQTEDGKYLDKDGNVVDEETKITLGDFTKGSDGKYTLTFDEVAPGKYTVTETNSDVEGYNLKEESVVGGDVELAAGDEETIELSDVYEEAPTTAKLVITKTFDGLNVTESELNGAIKFTVQTEDGKYLDKDGNVVDEETKITLGDFTKGSDGKYTLTFDEVAPGKYTVTETNSDVEGYKLKEESVVGGDVELAAGDEETIELSDVYVEKKGDLVITKTVDGDNLTEEEFEGALKFEVTTKVTEDGKEVTKWLDKDGKLSDEKVELTLKDGGFVKGDDGKYTKTFEDIALGKYTVTETNSAIEGYNLVEEKSATEGSATVEDGKTATVELEDVYVEQKGNLVITKTVDGDNLTEEEFEGALKFEVTTKVIENDKEVTKWLDKDGKLSDEKVELTLKDGGFVKGDDGKYTKTFEDIAIGEYTVVETNSAVEGYNLADSKSTTNGKATVEDGKTATVELEDVYVEQKGNLVITKTVDGDNLTEEEFEGALKFEVTTKVTEDGKEVTKWLDKDGKLSDEKVKLTLKDGGFELKDGKYTKTFEGVSLGDYTVTETNSDIDGYSLVADKSATEGSATVEDGKTATVELKDVYEKDKPVEKKGDLVITKTVDGDNITESEFEGALKFTVQNEDGKYLDKDGNLSDDKVELTLKDGGFELKDGKYTKTFEGVALGEYTITETNSDVDGYTLVADKSATGGSATVEDGKTATVELKDVYEKDKSVEKKGDLVITKTVDGDNITESEFEGALTFTVQNAEGKYLDKDGNLSDDKVELTLKDGGFELKDGKYTKTFEGVALGEYTVVETNSAVEGYNLVDSKSTTEGSATVEDGKTATVELKDVYEEEKPVEKKGNLVITKTVDGDNLTEEEFEGALTFTVQNDDGKYLDKDGNLSDKEVKLTLKDGGFVKGDDGKYTKTFEGVALGEYTVTEVNSDIDGYSLVTDKSATEGSATVEDGKTATVELKDVYVGQTGNLVITKTVDGDNLTEEEFEGALTFTVQNGDGKYLDKDGNLSDKEVKLTLKDGGFVKGDDGKYTKTFEGVALGEYTVTEINSAVEGYNLVEGKSTTEGTAKVEDGKTATVELKDVYIERKGNLVITKTVDGDNITESEFEGALKFTIQNEGGKYLDKDGNLSDTKVELTLKDGGFELKNGKYTKTFEHIDLGKYTVTETNSDVAGYSLKSDKSVTTGSDEVKAGETTTVDLKDVYEKFVFYVNKTDASKYNEKVKNSNIALYKVKEGTKNEPDGKELVRWLSDDGSDKLEVGKYMAIGGKYLLREEIAPTGFGRVTADTILQRNADGTVTVTVIDETGKEYNISAGEVYVDAAGDKISIAKDGTVLIEDDHIHFRVNKVDAGNGDEVEGAVLTLFLVDNEGTVIRQVDSWTSREGEVYDFGDKMECGKDYILRETTAPDGYEKITTDITVKVSDEGVVSTTLEESTDEDGNTVYLVENTKTKTPTDTDKDKDSKKTSKGVKTGDDAPLAGWLTVMFSSITGLAATLFSRRKNRNTDR